ncbi:hypothetical protein M0638_27935 [Roseomonas sp. NAR14]|uniref:Uncharacterized protein n=1 Tax=Roseomonas acroporae TaxID=2937791 RepID=A0A9X1YD21_9PROT|nr:hypothetical protein [Roseomonas acroporae]MCK8788184.1 hypothetical protein [Roseomonas acroporae]
MLLLCTILAVLAGAAFFGYAVDLLHLLPALQPIVVGLSIMAAAVFVRLNRGMPTLDWKTLEPRQRSNLTAAIVSLTAEYGAILAMMGITLVALVTITTLGVDYVKLNWSKEMRSYASSFIGALLSLCASRMAYVIWRDYDIVRLQKILIDKAGEKESTENQQKASSEKVVAMKSAGLRRISQEPPKSWPES